MRYLITFTCYGAHLHGDESGSVDRAHNVPGHRVLQPDPVWVSAARNRMHHIAYSMNAQRRALVLSAIREVSSHRRWNLLAAHVRTNHVHVIVECDARPEHAMNTFKAYASRRLRPLDRSDVKRWARHGSTRWLFTDQAVKDAIRYVVEQQGEAMAVFAADFV